MTTVADHPRAPFGRAPRAKKKTRAPNANLTRKCERSKGADLAVQEVDVVALLADGEPLPLDAVQRGHGAAGVHDDVVAALRAHADSVARVYHLERLLRPGPACRVDEGAGAVGGDGDALVAARLVPEGAPALANGRLPESLPPRGPVLRDDLPVGAELGALSAAAGAARPAARRSGRRGRQRERLRPRGRLPADSHRHRGRGQEEEQRLQGKGHGDERVRGPEEEAQGEVRAAEGERREAPLPAARAQAQARHVDGQAWGATCSGGRESPRARGHLGHAPAQHRHLRLRAREAAERGEGELQRQQRRRRGRGDERAGAQRLGREEDSLVGALGPQHELGEGRPVPGRRELAETHLAPGSAQEPLHVQVRGQGDAHATNGAVGRHIEGEAAVFGRRAAVLGEAAVLDRSRRQGADALGAGGVREGGDVAGVAHDARAVAQKLAADRKLQPGDAKPVQARRGRATDDARQRTERADRAQPAPGSAGWPPRSGPFPRRLARARRRTDLARGAALRRGAPAAGRGASPCESGARQAARHPHVVGPGGTAVGAAQGGRSWEGVGWKVTARTRHGAGSHQAGRGGSLVGVGRAGRRRSKVVDGGGGGGGGGGGSGSEPKQLLVVILRLLAETLGGISSSRGEFPHDARTPGNFDPGRWWWRNA